MEILGKLFGSEARVRLLRLFFLNPDTGYERLEVSRKTKTNPATVRRELAVLKSAGIIKGHKFYKEFRKKSRKGTTALKKRVNGWILDKNFQYSEQLKNLLVGADLVKKNQILRRFEHAGKIKLLIISGIFIKDDTSRTDLFIVGDKLKRGVIENTLRTLEAEAGKELRYAILDTPEFNYRMEMYDKFVRDILDYPHETIINHLGVGAI